LLHAPEDRHRPLARRHPRRRRVQLPEHEIGEPMPAPGENLRINGDRLWNSIHEMAKIGPGVAGGNNRQTLTDADGEGRHLFKRWCEEAGLTVGVDQMGTMFARREGADPDALPVYV